LGRYEFDPAQFSELPAEAQFLINSARNELEECLALQRTIADPRLSETEYAMAALNDGKLSVSHSFTAPADQSAAVSEGVSGMSEPLGGMTGILNELHRLDWLEEQSKNLSGSDQKWLNGLIFATQQAGIKTLIIATPLRTLFESGDLRSVR